MNASIRLCASVSGAVAVALGAFGAHALKGWLASLEDGAYRLSIWETAVDYHMWHALFWFAMSFVDDHEPRLVRVAHVSMFIGTVLFSGSLYALTLTGVKLFGAITPFGGLAFIVGWLSMALHARALQAR